MLKLNIKQIASARGTDRIFTTLRKNGISHNVATRLSTGNINVISLKHLEILCTIFYCTPNDLLQWTPNTNQKNDADHPLRPLNRQQPDLKNLLSTLPLDKLNEIAKIISDKK